MPTAAEKLTDFALKYPTLTAALTGAAAGAPVGAAFSEEGVEGRGAVQGALLGGSLGAVGGPAAKLLRSLVPSPQKALIVGGIGAGTLGGLLGQRKLSPWVMEHLKALADEEAKETMSRRVAKSEKPEDKEASVKMSQATLEKQAEIEKEATDRTLAFEFGMDTFMKNAGVRKNDFAKAAGVENPAELTDRTIAWVSDNLRMIRQRATQQ